MNEEVDFSGFDSARANSSPEEPTFCIIGNGILLEPHNYFIQWDRIDSYPKLAEWLRHLSEKKWVTKRHMHDLIMQTEHHFNWPHCYQC